MVYEKQIKGNVMKFILQSILFLLITPVLYGAVGLHDELHPAMIHTEKARYEINSLQHDIEVSNIELDYFLKKKEYKLKIMDYNEGTYKLQYALTIAISVLIFMLVLSGIYLAYIQVEKDVSGKENTTGIKVSKFGVEIGSSAIGLFILFMSFMFFYLYLKNIYVFKYVESPKSSMISIENNESK